MRFTLFARRALSTESTLHRRRSVCRQYTDAEKSYHPRRLLDVCHRSTNNREDEEKDKETDEEKRKLYFRIFFVQFACSPLMGQSKLWKEHLQATCQRFESEWSGSFYLSGQRLVEADLRKAVQILALGSSG